MEGVGFGNGNAGKTESNDDIRLSNPILAIGNVRTISLANFRDIGGHGTNRRRKVATNKVFRTSRPNPATANDVEIISKEYGVNTLVDLRTKTDGTSEFESRGELLLQEQYRVCKTPADENMGKKGEKRWLLRPLFNMGMLIRAYVKTASIFFQLLMFLLSKLFMKRLSQNLVIYRMNKMKIPYMYQALADYGGEVFRDTFRIFSRAENYPLMIFCEAGKDRTGITVAFLLRFLGVPLDDVVEDYYLSKEGILPIEKELHEHTAKAGFDADHFYSLERSYIVDLLSHVEGKHGSMKEYLLSIGLSEEELKNIERNLLTT